MGKRILVAVPVIIIMALAILLQGWVLAVFAVLLACASQFEIVRAMDRNGKTVIKPISYLFMGISATLFLISFPQTLVTSSAPFLMSASNILILFVVMTIACFVTAILSKKHTADSVTNTIFTFVYPQLFFILLYMLILTAGQVTYWYTLSVMLMVFIPAMFSDTFAYFIGKTFGKTKLCPDISPKKTVAGSVAGIVGGVAAGGLIWIVLFGLMYGYDLAPAPLMNYLIAGAILAIISQFGDLTASYIKRALGIKDFGKLLPGHGGIVDRMDSILFCMPVVYIMTYSMFIF